MQSEPEKPISEATLQAQARARRLSAAFAEVFGQPRNRTPAQKLVLEHLSICAGDDGNAYRFNDAKDGVALIAAGLHRDGAKSLLRVIERQLALSAKAAAPKTVKSTIKR